MGRAPNPGAPQRVSAHVVPKAPSFSTDDEDEKTTIESGGWEEEASTTVEQGEVADKIRALGVGTEQPRRGNTNITSTNGSVTDEPTVDDQRGAAALAMLPPQIVARLVITAGNDSGKAIEVRPGKTYTIGRGIDNDLVLTDIAVSRKHFDLRSENGAWVLADRGSGNGTLINNRLEDAPFMLASGDMIEIGNTAFRFDFPGSSGAVSRNGREFPSEPSYEGSADEDLESSTMSGKPVKDSEAATPAQLVPAVAARPKTLPPPAPLPRPRTQSSRPVVGYALERPGPASQSQPLPGLALATAPTLAPLQGLHALPLQPQLQTTLPLPQMANRPPLGPVALLDLPLGPLGAPLGAQPTTIPGQGPPTRPARLPFSYPSAQEISQQQPTPNGTARQMSVVAGPPGRDATTTALVPPMSYGSAQPVLIPQPPYNQEPQLTRRMKMALVAVGIALFAAVATVAIIKGATSGSAASPPTEDPDPRPIESKPIVEPIRDPRTVKSTGPTELPRADKPVAPAIPVPRADIVTPAPAAPGPIATGTAPPAHTVVPDKLEPAAPAAPSPTGVAVAANPPVSPDPAADPASATAEPAMPRADKATRAELVLQTARPDHKAPKHPDKKPDAKKPDAKKPEIARVDTDKPERTEVAQNPRTDKKRGGRTTQDVKTEAQVLYRAKNFSGAAALVTSALSSFASDDAGELKTIASIYSQLGKAYNIGMAPGTKPTEAFVALRHALDFDRDLGSVYLGELQERLASVAPRAAASFMAAKEYESAFKAVRQSESLGSKSSNNQAVRSMLEGQASDLLRSAQSDMATDPEGAKKKLREILVIVDARHPLYVRAQKLLNGS